MISFISFRRGAKQNNDVFLYCHGSYPPGNILGTAGVDKNMSLVFFWICYAPSPPGNILNIAGVTTAIMFGTMLRTFLTSIIKAMVALFYLNIMN